MPNPSCTNSLTGMKNASHSVVSDILRVGSSPQAVIRGGLAVLMVAIILDQHRCRAVSHYTRVLVRHQYTTSKSKSHIVETPQPLTTASGVLGPITLSSIPHAPKVSRPTSPHPRGLHPSPQEVKMPTMGDFFRD
uniref:Uncharacterized protein n=1 Tax=Magallana gigas TaxID=29159 RepID=A0A8W8L8A4_MAGGI